MIAHTLGNVFNLDAVTAFCRKYNLWLVEDCCDALGSTYKGRKVGTFGDIATVSFYPAHHITMGEGRAVMTDKQAALGLSQIAKLPHFIERRKENFSYLKSLLQPLEAYLMLPVAGEDSDPIVFGFS